jgi:serine protease Do
VTLSELKAADAVDDERGGAADGAGFGLTVEPLSAEQARTLGVKGVVITGVQPSGRAAEAGLRSGDVIEEVDGKAVESVDAFRTALKAGDRPALLLVHRSGATLFVTVDRVQK